MRWLVVCLAVAGCARAGQENSIIGGLTDAGPRRDATDVPEPDASPIDAPPQQITLTQTTSGAIAVGTSFNCHRASVTRENSYYRVFTLSDHGVTGMLHVTRVEFAIDTAIAGAGQGGQQPATVKLGTYGGTPDGTTLDGALVRSLGSADVRIPDGTGTRVTVPITADVAPTANLIVELLIPDGLAAGNALLVGTNQQGERKPGYTRGPSCGVTLPTSMKTVAADNSLDQADLILTVTGVMATPE
jgi:hypothetical protein